MLFKSDAPGRPLTVTLQTTGRVLIDSIRTAADGSYTFGHVADSPDGYEVVFSQEDNPELQAEIEKYATWAWLSPIRVSGAKVQVPAFDIALLTKDRQLWAPVSPAKDAKFGTGETIQFEWPSFAGNPRYWVDITRGQDPNPVWKSTPLMQTKASWAGTDAGDYWWAVGAYWDVQPPYRVTVYSYYTPFVLKP